MLAVVAAGGASCGGPQGQEASPTPTALVSVASVGPQCAEGKGDCDANPANACETDLLVSNTSCGACGDACSTGTRCVGGACRRPRLLAAHAGSICGVLWSTAQCWGESLSNPGVTWAQPRPVPLANGAIHISLGFKRACAVLPTGKVLCWGGDEFGELPGVEDAVEVEIGTSGTYVVTKSGEVRRFDGREPKSMDPLRLTDVVSVASGLVHDCALHRSGEVTCWGSPDFLGGGPIDGEMTPARYIAMTTKGVKVKGLDDAVQITASYGTTCAVRRGGDVVCWGNLDRTREDLGNTLVPQRVLGIDDAVEVTLNEGDISESHACAVRAGGALACWGDGTKGATGSGDPARKDVAPVKDLVDGVAVAAGRHFSCAIVPRGKAMCWGSARQGALGNDTEGDPRKPALVPGVSDAVALGLGEGYSCALDDAGKITCWGDPAAYTTVTKRGIPPRVIGQDGAFRNLFASKDTVCALDGKDVAICFDPLGVRPKQTLSALGPLRSIRPDAPVGVALSRSGQVVLYAAGGASRLPIPGLSDVVSVAQSTEYGERLCAVRKSGKVSCAVYANPLFGSVPGGKAPAPRVMDVQGIADAKAIVFGGPDFCVLHQIGDVTCFHVSELVPPTAATSPTAMFTPKLKRRRDLLADAITGLRGSVCVVGDGRVSCWGANYQGALGVGDDLEREDDVTLSLYEVVSIGAFPAFDGHTCAAVKSGEVYCWGANHSDQAGQRAPSFAFTPVAVEPPRNLGRKQ